MGKNKKNKNKEETKKEEQEQPKQQINKTQPNKEAPPVVQKVRSAKRQKKIEILKAEYTKFSKIIESKVETMKKQEIKKTESSSLLKRHRSQLLQPGQSFFGNNEEDNNSEEEGDETFNLLNDLNNLNESSRVMEQGKFSLFGNHRTLSDGSIDSNKSDIGEDSLEPFIEKELLDISEIIVKQSPFLERTKSQTGDSSTSPLTKQKIQAIKQKQILDNQKKALQQTAKNKQKRGSLIPQDIKEQEEDEHINQEDDESLNKMTQSVNFDKRKKKDQQNVKSQVENEVQNILAVKKDKKNKEKDAEKQIQKKKFQWSIFRRMLKYTRAEWKLNVIAFIFMLGQAATNMYIPKLSGELLDSTSKYKDMDRLHQYAILAVCVYLGNAFFDFLRTFCYHLLAERIVNALRNDCYKKFIQADIEFHDQTQSGELLSRLSSDISIAKSAVSGNLGTLIRNVVTSLGNLGFLVYMSWRLSVAIFVCVPLFIISSGYCVNTTKRLQRKYQKFLAKITQQAGECFQNIRTVKAFSTEDREIERFQKKSLKAYKHGYEQSLSQGLGNGAESLFSHFSSLAVLWYGGFLVLNQQTLTSGQLAAFLMYTHQLSTSATNISQCIQKIQTATGACERLFEMMDVKPKISLKTGEALQKYKVKIEFKDVTFIYPKALEEIKKENKALEKEQKEQEKKKQDKNADGQEIKAKKEEKVKILRKFNLVINPGDQVAFVGSSGSGKSTIIRLIERFYDTTKGTVFIDGHDIKSISLKDWRNQIGYVQQEPILFSGTIEQNITYGIKSCTQAELDEACQQASAYDFIHNTKIFPLGYKTNVGEAGGKLSGGQKQRIAIARALLRKPKVLIFDEATSALDAESEFQVQQAIDQLMIEQNGKLTILIIAHRLSTIAKCQRIIALHQGQIVEQGSYQQLMANNGFFKGLVERQLSQKYE